MPRRSGSSILNRRHCSQTLTSAAERRQEHSALPGMVPAKSKSRVAKWSVSPNDRRASSLEDTVNASTWASSVADNLAASPACSRPWSADAPCPRHAPPSRVRYRWPRSVATSDSGIANCFGAHIDALTGEPFAREMLHTWLGSSGADRHLRFARRYPHMGPPQHNRAWRRPRTYAGLPKATGRCPSTLTRSPFPKRDGDPVSTCGRSALCSPSTRHGN